jgi:hypothetical protein
MGVIAPVTVIAKIGNTPGRVFRVGQGTKQSGLREAKMRLQSMNEVQE